MRRPGEEGTALRVKAVSLCGTRKACVRRSDSPSPPFTHTLLGAHVWARGARPTSPARGRRWRGPSGSRKEKRGAARKGRSPDHLETRPPGRRAGEFVPSRGAPPQPPTQIQQLFLPQGHAQAHSRLGKGAESCATVPVPNLTVPPAGHPAPQPPLPTLLRSPKEQPLPRAGHTPGVANFYFTAAAAPNGVRANSRVSSCHPRHPRHAPLRPPPPQSPHCPPRHVQLPRPGFPLLHRVPRNAGLLASPGATATSRICACSRRTWRLDPDTAPLPLDRVTGGVRDPGSAQKRPSPAAGGAPPTRGPLAAPPSTGGPGTGGSSRALGAVSLGPPWGPLRATRCSLPAELAAALPGRKRGRARDPSLLLDRRPGRRRGEGRGRPTRVLLPAPGVSGPTSAGTPSRSPPHRFCSRVRAVPPPLGEHA